MSRAEWLAFTIGFFVGNLALLAGLLGWYIFATYR